MKVGTLTFHKANNYGAVLQAYGLQSFIKKNGFDTEIIDYTPNQNLDKKDITRISKILTFIRNPKKILERHVATKKNKKFSDFRKKNLLISEMSYNGDLDIEKKIPQYDFYISGSDQIWNTNLSNKSKAYYLHFVSSGKKISYAASFGKDYFNEYEKKYISSFLKKFDSISVRENLHADLLINQFNIATKVTLDPVFLLDEEEWQKLQSPIENLPKNYVLVYVLEYSTELLKCAQKKAEDLNCEIIYISLVKEEINGRVLKDIGPAEFLFVFSNASYICTNSFHGTAFSIIFNKNFSVIKHTSRNSRIENILTVSELQNRYYDSKASTNQTDINYEIVNSKIREHINYSKDFLINSLSLD